MSISPRETADRLIAVTTLLDRRLRRDYHSSHLTPARMSALTHIVTEGTCTGGQLAQAEGVTAPTMTRILDGLETDGFITRTPSKVDRRIVELRATSTGRAALAETRLWQVQKLAAGVSSLSESEREVVSDALDLIERLARG